MQLSRLGLAFVAAVLLSQMAIAGGLSVQAHAQRPPDEVLVFSLPDCQHCESAKALLDRRHMPYEVVDLSSPEGAARARRMGIPLMAPSFVYRGKLMKGFSIINLQRLIEE